MRFAARRLVVLGRACGGNDGRIRERAALGEDLLGELMDARHRMEYRSFHATCASTPWVLRQ
jgi:hypothetical protein